MRTEQAINANVIESLWGVEASAKGGGRMGVSAALWNGRPHPTYEIARPACDLTHVVSVWTKGEVTSELHLDGRVRFSQTRRRGTFQLSRAGESVRAVLSRASGTCLDLYIPVAFLQDCLETEFGKAASALELLPLKLQRDPVITTIADNIASELKAPDRASAVAVDSASLLLAVTLIRHYSNANGHVPPAAKGLAGWQKRKAIARIRDTIQTNTSLADLAAEVGLSPFHFARAFKRSVGLAPHQYQIHMRMELAKAMLDSGSQSITEVAKSVGYGDVSYFSRIFNQRFGISPKYYRYGRNS